MRTRIIFTACLFFALCQWSISAGLTQRWIPPKSDKVDHIDPAQFNRDCMTIKFVQGSRVRLRQGELVALSNWDMIPFESVIKQSKIIRISRLFSRPEETLDLERQRGQDRSGKELADLNLYYRVILDTTQSPEEFLENMLNLSIIEVAHANPIPSPAEDIEPETDNFSEGQGYLYDAPEGVDAPAAWEIEGGTGEGVKIIDIEGGWTFDHEDLREEFYLEGGDEFMWVNHGDAVIGILIAQHNDYGIDGICPDAQIGGRSVYPLDDNWPNVAEAINDAAEQLDEGDLYILELHNAFGGRMSPMETWQENFDAIETNSANGLICMQAGGNGNSDLDAELYQGRFDPENRHSGSIIVGAGAPPSGNFGPDRSRLDFSNYGQRVDLQGWGREVTTTGYGDLFFPDGDERQWYTAQFSGTSSATPIVSGPVACIQGIYKARTNGRLVLTGNQIRDILVETGTPQNDEGIQGHIGPRPNLREAVQIIPFTPCTLFGTVFDPQTDLPIEGAIVSTDYGFSVTTDSLGNWLLEDAMAELAFTITAVAQGYLDSALVDLVVEEEDTLEINLGLLHSEFTPSIENIVSELEIGESEQFDISISNQGNGVLDWSVETTYRGDAARDPWELRRSFSVGEQLDDNRVYGVAYIDSRYYIAGANTQNPTIYILNADGELIDTFAQPGEDLRGMRDLAYDGELIWGVSRDTVYGMTVEGEVETSFEAPYNPSNVITWDSNREVLWISGTVSHPVAYDREGNWIDEFEVDREGLRIYGLAYFADDPDNAPLYIYHKEIDTNRQTLVKHNFETNEKIFVTYLDPETGGTPQGAFITNKLDGYSWVFMSVANISGNDGGDRLNIWQLYANTSWSIIDPGEGSINPAEDQSITLIIDATDLGYYEYPAQLVFSHNGIGSESIIPIDLTISPNEVGKQEGTPLPMDFAITGVYPNPFNSTVKLNFAVPKASSVSIKLYDLTGRVVAEIANGYHQPGQHSTIWNAAGVPSGLYFARMEAGGFSQTVKLMLMK